jgi:hypothetical protein
MSKYEDIGKGHTVHYKTPQGQTGKGKVVMKGPAGWVINRGKGQPQVVNKDNFLKTIAPRTNTMKESYEEMIRAATEKDAVSFQSTMTDVLNAKIMERIEAHKIEVASNLYNAERSQTGEE